MEEYNRIEILGVVLMGFFGIIVVFQLIGMLGHRLSTLGHTVSTTHIRFQIGEKDAYDVKKIIEKHGYKIVKDMIQNVQVNDFYIPTHNEKSIINIISSKRSVKYFD